MPVQAALKLFGWGFSDCYCRHLLVGQEIDAMSQGLEPKVQCRYAGKIPSPGVVPWLTTVFLTQLRFGSVI